MKYTLSQYVHDALRLKLIDQESNALLGYKGNYSWVGERLAEIVDEKLEINRRMAKFERHPNNR